MRATASAVVRRIQRALRFTVLVVVEAALFVTVAAVLHTPPPVEVSSVKFLVLKAVDSPPAPACRTTNLVSWWLAPRSTSIDLAPATPEHHLSLLPPDTLPFTAFAGPSLALHEA